MCDALSDSSCVQDNSYRNEWKIYLNLILIKKCSNSHATTNHEYNKYGKEWDSDRWN